MSTPKHFKVGVVMIVVGFVAFLAAPYGVYHYRDEAAKRADTYMAGHRQDYKSGDFARALDGYLDETRLQRWGFFGLQFVGFGVACWGASLIRNRHAAA